MHSSFKNIVGKAGGVISGPVLTEKGEIDSLPLNYLLLVFGNSLPCSRPAYRL